MKEEKLTSASEPFAKSATDSDEHDAAITDSFRSAVRHTVDFSKSRGCPIARYDAKRKAAYLEYPDGSKVYHEKA